MTNLEKLYQSIATFKELGLALNEDMLQKANLRALGKSDDQLELYGLR